MRRYLHLQCRTKHVVWRRCCEVPTVIYEVLNGPIRGCIRLAAGNMEPVYSTVALFCTVQLQIICTAICPSLSKLVTSFLLPFTLYRSYLHTCMNQYVLFRMTCVDSKLLRSYALNVIGQTTRVWFSLLSSEELEYTAKTWYKLVLYNMNVYFLDEPEYVLLIEKHNT